MHACLAVTCHLHFLQNDQDLWHATVVTQWPEQKVNPGEENLPATPAGTQTHNLLIIEFSTLATELPPLHIYVAVVVLFLIKTVKGISRLSDYFQQHMEGGGGGRAIKILVLWPPV